MSQVLIIKTGSTVPRVAEKRRDFDVWISAGMGLQDVDVRVVRVARDEPLPEPSQTAGVVVTGSPAMVTEREPWSERTGQWLLRALEQEVPLLGICYGHQLLAQALGGRVGDNPLGRNIGTVDVQLTEAGRGDPLFADFGGHDLHLPVSHVQSVLELPPQARLLATTALDPNHAFAVGERAWGVQFHPEFDAQIVRGYVDEREDQIRAEGLDPDGIRENAIDSADGTILLRRFARLARGSEG